MPIPHCRADSSFTDEEVLSKDFQDKIKAVLDVVTPFVHMSVVALDLPVYKLISRLNDLMTLPAGTNDNDDDEGNDEGVDGEDDE